MIWDRLGVLTDEISPSLTKALDWAVQQKLRHVEIRTVDGINVMNLTDDQLIDIRNKVEQCGLFVSAVASPVFKCALDLNRPVAGGDTFGLGEEDITAHFAKLERAIDIAKLLGTSRIRIFSFWREQEPERYIDDIAAHLNTAAVKAGAANVTLLLENEPSCNGGYAAEVGALARRVNHPSLKVLWDPGNEAYGGRHAFPQGYELVKDTIGHVHLKDALIGSDGSPRCVPIGEGSVAYFEQIDALERDGYSGLYTIETHYIPEGGTPMEGTQRTIEGLYKLLASEDFC
ncbi:sugar phosphate isomerase/epimerase family protein [Paenibacillus radicis (ex Xue et al. 2023)]|uniref:Sugar phosphate isomerase/epimerase n=1 Tax=Paenibacillus radicis (ex Xue et al. 2023) TaxID=2972489 RepID=A0ABT1YGB1_9BACL|nr:sugar phosphate isomerase/epimerase family protein [Paenibacillus radicis (ex Xue et al. 2023)]MCR8632239.1 sugar phosphate isomerase/epimerase [Paenibacillus radicis (ex Xue et al. 2023)]